jgi:hypothetical protein
MKRRYIFAVLIALFVLACLGVFFQPNPSYDLSKLHPRLRNLKTPYRSVSSDFYADGGSIGIGIVDQDDNKEYFFVSARDGRMYFGVPAEDKTNQVEIIYHEHTKRMLICILSDAPHRTAYDDANLASLRRYPKDYIIVLLHRLYGDFKDGSGIKIY